VAGQPAALASQDLQGGEDKRLARETARSPPQNAGVRKHRTAKAKPGDPNPVVNHKDASNVWPHTDPALRETAVRADLDERL